jgi:glycosyltransferase involved in cell wall biosynthesis
MRILHLHHLGSNLGGAEGYIVDLATGLAKAGHSSHLVHFVEDQGDLIADTTYVPLTDRTPLADTETPVLERVITEFRPDVAYVHVVYRPDLVRWIAHRLPTVAYVHSPYLLCPGYAQYLRRTSRVCPHKAGMICILNAQIEHCCFGRSPLTHARRLAEVRAFIRTYQTIPILTNSTFMKELLHRNQIPLELIGVLPPVLIEDSSPEYVPPSDSRKVLYVGRLTPEKGLRRLIEAMAPLESDWELVVAGEGREQGPCRELATRLNVAHKVNFLGWLSQSELESLYQKCAFVVVPSIWPEPFGRVGPEAFLHGRPVVAFAVGGVPDWLGDGITGYLVPPDDVVQLRRRIQLLLESPSQQVQMGNNARAHALKVWNADLHIRSLLDYFAKAVARPGAS